MNEMILQEPNGDGARRIDYRELVIMELADSERALLTRIGNLELDVDAYRAVAQEALHAIRALTLSRDRLRTLNAELRAELKALRAIPLATTRRTEVNVRTTSNLPSRVIGRMSSRFTSKSGRFRHSGGNTQPGLHV